jgi:thioesterase domain-containing protein
LALRHDAPIRCLYVPGEAAATRTGVDVATAARSYYEVLKQHHSGGPFSLLGFCIGGAMAFEVARLAEADGMDVSSVVILDAVVFARQRRRQLVRIRKLLGRVARADRRNFLPLAAKAGDRLWTKLAARLNVGQIPHEELSPAAPGDDEALARILASYHPSGTIKTPVVLVISDDPEVYGTWRLTEQFGWEGAFLGQVDTLTIQGGHEDILLGATATQLGARLGSLLDARTS